MNKISKIGLTTYTYLNYLIFARALKNYFKINELFDLHISNLSSFCTSLLRYPYHIIAKQIYAVIHIEIEEQAK